MSNLDIAPTVADVLGASLKSGLSYAGSSLLRPVAPDRLIYSTATYEWRKWGQTAVAVSRGTERMICDSRDKCRLGDLVDGQIVLRGKADAQSELFKHAAANPVLRQALGQIYHAE